MKIFCPYCLTIHDPGEPPVCPEREDAPEIPRLYIKNYERVKPLWLAAIGFSQHGKSSFISSLTLMLEKANKFWDGTSVDYLDDYTLKYINSIRDLMFQRKAQEPTRLHSFASDEHGNFSDKHIANNMKALVPRPLIIQVNSIPNFNSRCLVIYDTAGEYFENLTGIRSEVSQYGYLKSLKAVKNIWLMISLSDLADSEKNVGKKNIRDLLNVYIVGMQNMGWDIKGNNLIVVYTKADKFKNNQYIPSTLRDYLDNDDLGKSTRSDSYWDKETFFKGGEKIEFNLQEYLQEMDDISSLLYGYTKDKLPFGSAFLSLAKEHEVNVYFTINSALGTDLIDGEGYIDITSQRVLDPLLWVLKLNADQGDPEPVTIKLVLDSEFNTNTVSQRYALDLENLISELGKLSDEVVTYYLGKSKPCAESGQKLPASPPKIKYPYLVRPILEDNKSYCVILTARSILDLDDLYMQKNIEDQVLVVSFNETYEPRWSSSINFRPGDKIDLIVGQIKKMMQRSA